jgi:3-dehydroquinate synthase
MATTAMAAGSLGDGLHVRSIRIGDAVFPYYSGFDCIGAFVEQLKPLEADRFIVVTDDTVLALHGDALLAHLRRLAPTSVFSHEPGESMKTLQRLSDFVERALEAGTTRRSVVVAFGGGVPGNVGGLLASLLFRGIRLVNMPTTTMAAMDSALSLKQAVNSTRGKNHIGAYVEPYAVFTDVRLLTTLPARELRSGLCEAAKNCLAICPAALPTLHRILADGDLRSPESLLWLLEESIAAKRAVTMEDSREQSTGLTLEYGHTVGHAVELADFHRRGSKGLSHGDAVALGMIAAARISHARGWLSDAELDAHVDIVLALGAPLCLPPGVTVDDVMALVRSDNKRGYLPTEPDSIPFVLLESLGRTAGRPELPLVGVRSAEVVTALDALVSAGPVMSNADVRAR